MKQFHFSDILSVTTGRLVSTRHMDGIYDILNFLTEDNLYTHQLPRAMKECEPWLRQVLAPKWFPEHHEMSVMLADLIDRCSGDGGAVKDRNRTIGEWLANVKIKLDLPDNVDLMKMDIGSHVQINPILELEKMVGADKIIVVEA
jgi:hypothetical protein